MNEVLKKIYDEVVSQERDAVKILSTADAIVKETMQTYKSKLSDDELEQLQDLLFSTILVGEQAGFEIGMKFALKMLQ